MPDSKRRSSRSDASAGRARGGRGQQTPTRLAGGLGIAALTIAAAAFVILRPDKATQAAWSRLGTEDVHALAFVGDDPSRLVFGHHGGLLSSSDGGRTWLALGTTSDAMGVGALGDASIVIAGHEVLAASGDGGRTWTGIPANLPSRDIHGFTRDPADPARMWAALATGGLWETRDGGTSWERVQGENVVYPTAVTSAVGTKLFGVTVNGLQRSDDGGKTWQAMTTPALYPMVSLAGTADGLVLLAAGPDGLARSDNGGLSWSRLAFSGSPAAVAVTAQGRTVGVVTRSTEFFRSDDGGNSWPGP